MPLLTQDSKFGRTTGHHAELHTYP
jgi:hypothetical protein